MMRRLTGLLIVFALALPAKGVLSLYVDGSPAPGSVELVVDEVLTIQIYDDNTTQDGYIAYIMRDVGGVGGLYNLWELYRDPDVVRILPDVIDPDDGEGFELVALSIYGDISPGIHFTVDYSSSVVGSSNISLYDSRVGYSTVDSLGITVVPEPTTIALLAVGALAMVRKRRR